MGTPKYAAPEQFAGNKISEKLSCATDIYEAGVTLYELITKQNPFIAKTIAMACDLHQTVGLKKTPTISPAVFDVLQKATSIDPADRYQTAAEMKRALQQALMNPQGQTSRKWMWPLIAGIIVVIAMIVLLFSLAK